MNRAFALIRAHWRAAASYRLRLIISIVSLGATVVPLYFVANALQPVMSEHIQAQGGEYFGFLIVGMMTFLIIPTAVNSLPGAVSSGISTGVLEALLGTPSKPASILSGMIGFDLLWNVLRSGILLLAGWILGANLIWSQLIPAFAILGLILLAYLPFGLIAASLVIAFRTPGPLAQGVLALSALLGGVYYPTTVIPSWIQSISDFVPLTYGLRALRQTLLEGASFVDVLPDVAILSSFVVVLFGISALAFSTALRYARREGTLAQY